MPLAPPVTIAILPDSLAMLVPLEWWFGEISGAIVLVSSVRRNSSLPVSG
jgi:hypothetical protein